jgi:hypothetical protein
MRDYRSPEAALYRKWYKSAQWRARRLEQLSREPLCRYCQAQGVVTAASVADHVIEHRGDRDLFFFGELQSLCQSHHSSTAQRIERNGGPLIIHDKDGYPIEIETPKGNQSKNHD